MDAPIGLRLVQGSHIVVPRLYGHHSAYLLQQPDQRIVFVLPFEQDFTLIGTTDVDYDGDPAQVRAASSEVAYLCAAASRWLRTPVQPADVVWQYSGVRPLLADHHHDAAKVTRDYRLQLDASQAPLLSVLGGKLTTYRTLAEEAVDQLGVALGRAEPAWTADGAPLPGGDLGAAPVVLAKLQAQYPGLSETLLATLARRYGSRASAVLGDATSTMQLGTAFGADLYAREVDYLVAHEWVRTLDDLLWRRTKLGLRLDAAQREGLAQYLAHRVAAMA
jgi:glycerol-3-phosphate dehydrogenase